MGKSKMLFKFLSLGIIVALFSSCATCATSYRKNLTEKPQLSEANNSYKKAIHWAAKGDCEIRPFQAREYYRKAESYLSDAIFKLEQLGHDNKIDVSEELYYCKNLKGEIHEDIVKAEKAMLP